MSSSTQVFLSSTVQLEDIAKVIERTFDTTIDYHPTQSPSFQQWIFKVDGTKRILSLHTNLRKGGFCGTLLSLGSHSAGIRVMKTLVELFGGFFTTDDNEGTWDSFQGQFDPEDGLPYFVRAALVNGKKPSDLNALVAQIKEFEVNVGDSQIKGLKS